MALTQAEVLAAALQILDEQGLPDLTMRRLADQLGVRASAIYWHYRNKQSILAALADEILGDVPAPNAAAAGPGGDAPAGLDVPDGAWRSAVATWADGVREALLTHRDAADVVLSMRAMGLLQREPELAPAAALRDAGLTPAEALQGARTLLHFVLGHVYQEQSRAQYAALGVAEGAAAADQAGFDAGVALVLDGCAARLAR